MWRGRKATDLTQLKALWVSLLLALAIGFAATLGGVSLRIEGELRQLRDTLQKTPASGEIAVLEIDGRSLQMVDSWPWPRSIHADAIAELQRLGARQIAFDVDFSSRSDAAGDRKLAEQLAQSGGDVVLPTFRQVNRADGLNTVTETTPLPEFAQHAFLASVNVHPQADGQVALYPYGVTTSDIARPSLASMIAGKSGHIDEEFRIDQAIDPTTIPRISFIDLLEGRVERERIEGRSIVVGATAIELGDRYPTGLYGVIPGVLIQAQAAETLVQDRVRSDINSWFVFGLAMLAMLGFAIWRKTRDSPQLTSFALAATLAGVGLLLDTGNAAYLPLAPALIPLAAFLVTFRILQAAIKLHTARMTDSLSGLPNRHAMIEMRNRFDKPTLAAARIADFEQLETMVDATKVYSIDKAFAERMELLAVKGQIFRIERGLFGWIVRPGDAEDLESYFAKVRALLNAPLMVEGTAMKVVANLGSSVQVIGDAVSAAEHAHRTGQFWSDTAVDIQAQSQSTQNILLELDEALENGAIWVAYQPKYRFADKQISGAECLVRWDSPVMGRIGPDQFIPVLEGKGRMTELTLFVLRDALARLSEAHSLGRSLNLAVNVSAQLLANTEFVEEVAALLAWRDPIEGGQITIEITESAPLADGDQARAALEKLSAAGARISIDDYGTGQATLTYLQGFPADEVKLDQAFVKNFTSVKADEIMVRSTIELAHALGFEMVAEGIEDGEALDALAQLGCDYGQGWHIGKPARWEEFVAKHLCDAAEHSAAA